MASTILNLVLFLLLATQGYAEDVDNQISRREFDYENMCMSQGYAMHVSYEEKAEIYDNDVLYEKITNDMVGWADFKPGQKILDLGTGTGLLALKAKSHVGPSGDVYAIDRSRAMLAVARRKSTRSNMKIHFIHTNINDLHQLYNLLPHDFDTITCSSAFMFVEDGQAALKQWARFLKPGGRIIFNVDDVRLDSISYSLALAAKQLGLPTIAHTKWIYSAADVDRMIRSAGMIPFTFASPIYAHQRTNAWSQIGHLKDKFKQAFYHCLARPDLKTRALEIINQEIQLKADAEGWYDESVWYWIGIATKPE